MWKGNSNHEVYLLYSDTVNNRILFTSNSFKLINPDGKLLDDKVMAVKDLVYISANNYALAATGFCANYNPVEKNASQPELKTLLNNVRGKSIAQLPGTSVLIMATNTGLWMNDGGKTKEIKTKQSESFFVHQLLAYHDGVLALNPTGKLFFINRNLSISSMNIQGPVS